MLALLHFWKIGVGLLAGLAIGWIVFEPLGHARGYDRGHGIGVSEERAVWQKREAEAAEKREHERAVTQTRIDRIESDYHQRDQARQADMAELERALAEAETDVPIPTASPGAPPVCRPAVLPRSLSDALGRIGRAAPRDGAASPPAAVPGSR